MRTNLDTAQLWNPRISGMRHNNVVIALTATLIVPNDGPTLWICDGGLSNRTVRLPELSYERQVIVANDGATNDLNITDSAGNALVTIPPQAIGHFYAGSSRWVWGIETFTNASAITPTDVTVSTVITTSDTVVRVNGVGAVVLTLPTAAGWQSVSGRFGHPLAIYDVSGNAQTNNITINPAVGETISGLAQVVVDSNFGSVYLRPRPSGGWIF